MAAGVPVVACAVGGIPEVVSDGVSGYLVAPGDKANLERALRWLLDRPRARRAPAAPRRARPRGCASRPSARSPQLEDIYGALGLRRWRRAP